MHRQEAQMSDQNTGGDGSVRWTIDAENVREHQVNRRENNSHVETGVDRSGKPGDWFTISIKVPREIRSKAEFLARLRDADDKIWSIKEDPDPDEQRVEFNLRIEPKTPDQIRISWGSSGHVHRPDGQEQV
jgi:hypothetical protein